MFRMYRYLLVSIPVFIVYFCYLIFYCKNLMINNKHALSQSMYCISVVKSGIIYSGSRSWIFKEFWILEKFRIRPQFFKQVGKLQENAYFLYFLSGFRSRPVFGRLRVREFWECWNFSKLTTNCLKYVLTHVPVHEGDILCLLQKIHQMMLSSMSFA